MILLVYKYINYLFIDFVSVNNDDRVVSILSEWCDAYHSIEMEKAKDPGFNRLNPIKYFVFKVNAYLDIQFEGNALDLLYTQVFILLLLFNSVNMI